MTMERPTDQATFDPTTDKLYTTNEVAEFFSVTSETVRDWITTGKLSAVRLGSGRYRVPRRVLMDFANHRFGFSEAK